MIVFDTKAKKKYLKFGIVILGDFFEISLKALLSQDRNMEENFGRQPGSQAHLIVSASCFSQLFMLVQKNGNQIPYIIFSNWIEESSWGFIHWRCADLHSSLSISHLFFIPLLYWHCNYL